MKGQAYSWLRWGRSLFLLLLVAAMYIWSWNAAGMQPSLLIEGAPKARHILLDLLRPHLLERGEETQTAETVIEVPCSAAPPQPPPPAKGPRLSLSKPCAAAREPITVTGEGFRPNTQGRLYWLPRGLQGRLRDARFTTDAQGRFQVETTIPPLLEEQGGLSGLQVELSWESGQLRPSEPLRITLAKIIETIFLALMATTAGGIVAVPLSFLGARNLMPRTWLGTLIYGATRTFFNLTRSIEPIILATIFAIWVGFGPFAGVLALSVVTVASLGKLYSEAVESIDPGPIEAIRATGANEAQVIVYAVIPQIIPPYLAFTIYHWDINVRISTIIGFVGGGGIGFVLRQWINQTQWTWASVAVWAIVIVVWAMDYTSARVREVLV
ncbi:MAG: phosphonate ABC transporter, permease protein PhnE [Chloroflexi bacterium]|nr:MAG: phosphonate ABC transporter, permease protein PhnE [Chloroflexota bacterium]